MAAAVGATTSRNDNAKRKSGPGLPVSLLDTRKPFSEVSRFLHISLGNWVTGLRSRAPGEGERVEGPEQNEGPLGVRMK